MPAVTVDVGDLAATRRGVRERRVVGHQAEVVLVDLDAAEGHRLDGAVVDLDVVGLARPVVRDRERVLRGGYATVPVLLCRLIGHDVSPRLRFSKSLRGHSAEHVEWANPRAPISACFFQPPPKKRETLPAPRRTWNSGAGRSGGGSAAASSAVIDSVTARSAVRLTSGASTKRSSPLGSLHDDPVEDVLAVVVEHLVDRGRARPRRTSTRACRARRPSSGRRVRRRSTVCALDALAVRAYALRRDGRRVGMRPTARRARDAEARVARIASQRARAPRRSARRPARRGRPTRRCRAGR